MRYFFRKSEAPEAEDFGEPRSLHRFQEDEEDFVVERFDAETQTWVDNPNLIRFIGVGGDENYWEIEEAEAGEVAADLVGNRVGAIEDDDFLEKVDPNKEDGKVSPDEKKSLIADVRRTLRRLVSAISSQYVAQSSDVARHGKHIGQEGRKGEKGGTKPGFKHEDGNGSKIEDSKKETDGKERKFTDSEEDQKEASVWAEENFLADYLFEEENIVFLGEYKNSAGVYQSLNEAFRSESEFIFENRKVLANFRDAIDEAMDKSVVPEDLILYRGISNQTAQRLLKSGEAFTDPAYVSTSLTPFDAEQFAFQKDAPAILEISVPKGTKGIYMEPFSTLDVNEEEILLNRGLTFEFTSREARVSETVDFLGENFRIWEVRVVGRE